MRIAPSYLLKSPGLVATAALTLALGIGVTTAVYSAVDQVLVAPVPYPHGDQIVKLSRTVRGGAFILPLDADALAAWQAAAQSVEAISGVDEGKFIIGESAVRDSFPGAHITPGLLRTLGVQPVLGRPFSPSDTAAGAAPVALVSRSLWRSAFNGRGDILGAPVHVDGLLRTIVGVVPDNLVLPGHYDSRRDVLLPLSLDSITPAFTVYARLRQGVQPLAASNELKGILRLGPTSSIGVQVSRARDLVPAKESQALKLLMIAACALLAIACVNVAGLLIARGIRRQREFAIRRALGAVPSRLAALVLGESTLMSLIGGALGVALAYAGLHAIVSGRPQHLQILTSVYVNTNTLMLAVGIAVLCGAVSGTLPAVIAARVAPANLLQAGGRLSTGGRVTARVRWVFVAAEVALAVVLLTGAGLVTHSFINLLNAPTGLNLDGLYQANLTPRDRLHSDAAWPEIRTLMARTQSLPGVVRAQPGQPPTTGAIYPGTYQTDRPDGPDSTGIRLARVYNVTPGYFQFLGMQILAGRDFQATDQAKGARSVIVNQGFARRMWPGRNPLGLRFRASPTQPWLTVVGVVNDIHFPLLKGDAAENQIYMPGDAASAVDFMLRSVDVAATTSAFRNLVNSEGPDLIFSRLLPTHELVDGLLRPKRFAMGLMGAFAILAFLLTAVGIYSLIAYNVGARTREMGIRIALGARQSAIYRLVVGESLRVVAIGLVVGAGAMYAANKTLSSLLTGLSLDDPLVLIAVPLLLLVAATLAALGPARRAGKADPPLRVE